MSAPVLCSWCDEPATRNLDTARDQCCEAHWLQWFAQAVGVAVNERRESEHAAHMAILATPTTHPRNGSALPALTIVPKR